MAANGGVAYTLIATAARMLSAGSAAFTWRHRMAIGIWIDYSSGRVSGAAMTAAGIVGAARYVGIGGAGKRLTRAEYSDHVAHGRRTVAVVEKNVTDADGGAAAGIANARLALADIRNITAGLAPIQHVFATNDKPTFSQTDVDYVRAFRTVFAGTGIIVGPYGFGLFLAACAKAGLAPIAWQAGPAPSRTGTTAIATFWQRQGGPVQASDGPTSPVTRVIDGVNCDINNQLKELAVSSPIDKLSAADVGLLRGVAQRYAPGNTGGQRNAEGDMAETIFALEGQIAKATAGLATSAEVAALSAKVDALTTAVAAIQQSTGTAGART
jgi:hypothetical protein